jgi:hypothetical protein
MKTLGQIAYEAYCESVNNLSPTGITLPRWEDLTNNIRKAWGVAAKAVAVVLYQKYVIEGEVECICAKVASPDGSYVINSECELHGFSGSHK